MSDLPEAAEASETVDAEVLRLRGEGQPYARISRDLGLAKGADAQRAFMRALSLLSDSDATRVRTEEISRLDRLAERIRADTGKNDMDKARQLKIIQRMRTQVSQDN